MALTPTVTKVSVTGGDGNIHQVTLNLTVNDGATDVINQDFSVQYRPNFDSVPRLIEKLHVQMQTAIDAYKSHKQIFDSPALNNATTNIQNNLVM